MPPASSTNRLIWVIPLRSERSDLPDRIREAGSAGDWHTLNRVGAALNDAYELARVHDIDADRDEANRRVMQTASPIWRDPRVSEDVDSDTPDYAKEQ